MFFIEATMNYQTPLERTLYFLTHFLPWICVGLVFCSALICFYHRYNRSCMFEYLKEDEDNSSTTSYKLCDGV